MHKYKHWMIVLVAALVVVGTAFTPHVVHAESDGGEGVLVAEGDGIVGVRGNGTINITGNGVLWIVDHEGDAEIEVSGEGRKQELANGRTRYVGFEGEAMVSGSRVTVVLSGYDITLEASGIGRFWLRGEGSFSTGAIEGDWQESVKSYRFE